MSIAGWMLVWKTCLVVTVAGFAVMSIIVSIGGAYDLRRLFRSLAARKDDTDNP